MEDQTPLSEQEMAALKKHPMYQMLINADYTPCYMKDCKVGDYVVIAYFGISIAGYVTEMQESGDRVVAHHDIYATDVAFRAPHPKCKTGDIIKAKYGNDDDMVLMVAIGDDPPHAISAYEEDYSLDELEDIKIIMTEEEALNYGHSD